jgi:hypothetical protein
MTGRGGLGSFERAGKTINKVAFSAKFAASQIQTLTKLKTAKTPFARKQASLNLMSLLASTFTMMATIKMLWPDRVELNPRSSNFCKIKVGANWNDISGGFCSYLTVSARDIRAIIQKHPHRGYNEAKRWFWHS